MNVKGVRKLNVKSGIILIVVALVLLGCAAHSNPSADHRRFVTYEVQPGDTLWEIAEIHADLNTYSRIYMPVFMESIREANYDKFANNRFLQPGDRLTIYYFVKE